MTLRSFALAVCAVFLFSLAAPIAAQDEEKPPEPKPTDYEKSKYIAPAREKASHYIFDEHGQPTTVDKKDKGKEKDKEKAKPKKKGAPQKKKSWKKPGKRRPWQAKAKPKPQPKPEDEEGAEGEAKPKPEAEEGVEQAQPAEDKPEAEVSTDEPEKTEEKPEGGEKGEGE